MEPRFLVVSTLLYMQMLSCNVVHLKLIYAIHQCYLSEEKLNPCRRCRGKEERKADGESERRRRDNCTFYAAERVAHALDTQCLQFGLHGLWIAAGTSLCLSRALSPQLSRFSVHLHLPCKARVPLKIKDEIA